MSQVVRAVAVVSGHVQGVGLGAAAGARAERARRGGQRGPSTDGRVEVELAGPAEGVDAVLAALEGPEAPGTVRSVMSRREPARGVRQFTTE